MGTKHLPGGRGQGLSGLRSLEFVLCSLAWEGRRVLICLVALLKTRMVASGKWACSSFFPFLCAGLLSLWEGVLFLFLPQPCWVLQEAPFLLNVLNLGHLATGASPGYIAPMQVVHYTRSRQVHKAHRQEFAGFCGEVCASPVLPQCRS